MTGGSGADTFEFGAGDEGAVVTDLSDQDALHFASDNVAQVILDTAAQSGADTILTFNSTQITLRNVDSATLTRAGAEITLTEAANSAPVASVADQTIGLDEYAWKRLDSELSVSDADGDAITQYEIYDSAGGDNWWADGGVVDAATGYTTSNLSDIWFKRDDVASTQTLWVRAHDGEDWSNWDSFDLITA